MVRNLRRHLACACACLVSVLLLGGFSSTALSQSLSQQDVNAFFQTEQPCRFTSLVAVRQVMERQEFISVSLQVHGDPSGTPCASSEFIQDLAFGVTDQVQIFEVDQRLTAASLKLTIPMTMSLTGQVVPFEVDVVWDGVTGQLSFERSHQANPGSTSQPKVSHIHGYTRPARPSGTISDGMTNYSADANTVDGLISVRRQHEVIPKPRLFR